VAKRNALAVTARQPSRREGDLKKIPQARYKSEA
jgi:hypothetical protein